MSPEDCATSRAMLRWMYDELAKPMEEGLKFYQPPEPDEERQAHLLWHFGHAASDLARALVDPFGPDPALSAPYGEDFRGFKAHLPWEQGPPGFGELSQWWEGLFGALTLLTPHYAKALAAPVDLGDRQIQSPRQAWDYALFHTGFHLGRCHQMLGW